MGRTFAILAEFANPAELLAAAKAVRKAGYRHFDCHSPFPIHGMDQAMGLKRSPLGFIVGGLCIVGASIGFGLQTWVHTIEYPLIIAGKPFFSWQAFIIVTFALLVLFGAFGAVLGMLSLSGLPRLHHPLFYSDNFSRFSRDAYFVSIEAIDAHFDAKETWAFLESIGGRNLELVEEPSP
ncbi:MAG: DUF3341 domain-containing protein [Fidelibacterota bacterium]|nr:MAG: DUF3341 domain-containing protein [Candidatus Neomarinimicrobiota bacterium]